MAEQELPPCHRHPDKLCPGECQYILIRGLCIHELKPGDPFPTYEGTLYPERGDHSEEVMERLRALEAEAAKWPWDGAGEAEGEQAEGENGG